MLDMDTLIKIVMGAAVAAYVTSLVSFIAELRAQARVLVATCPECGCRVTVDHGKENSVVARNFDRCPKCGAHMEFEKVLKRNLETEGK